MIDSHLEEQYDDLDARDFFYSFMPSDDLKIINHAADHLIGLIQCLYESGDVSRLEEHLEEIAYVLQVNLPKNRTLKICKLENK
jgi:hypothetical protein